MLAACTSGQADIFDSESWGTSLPYPAFAALNGHEDMLVLMNIFEECL